VLETLQARLLNLLAELTETSIMLIWQPPGKLLKQDLDQFVPAWVQVLTSPNIHLLNVANMDASPELTGPGLQTLKANEELHLYMQWPP
jgi:hypothetical protein